MQNIVFIKIVATFICKKITIFIKKYRNYQFKYIRRLVMEICIQIEGKSWKVRHFFHISGGRPVVWELHNVLYSPSVISIKLSGIFVR